MGLKTLLWVYPVLYSSFLMSSFSQSLRNKYRNKLKKLKLTRLPGWEYSRMHARVLRIRAVHCFWVSSVLAIESVTILLMPWRAALTGGGTWLSADFIAVSFNILAIKNRIVGKIVIHPEIKTNQIILYYFSACMFQLFVSFYNWLWFNITSLPCIYTKFIALRLL